MSKRGLDKRAQVTLFVVLAILILGSVAAYFLFRGSLIFGGIPVRFQGINQYFIDCGKESTQIGVEMLEKQGGYIYLPDFSPGSEYAPTSSQLNFFGAPVPYWYYLSGGNVIKEQVPTKSSMEEQLSKFIEDDLGRCSLDSFAAQGFLIDRGSPEADVSINGNSVDIVIKNPISASFGDEKAILSKFTFSIDTKLGSFYNNAVKIYNYEKSDAFLENYAVDVLRLYAPVDGVEISCSPKVWVFDSVVKDIEDALEANTQVLKIRGDYYTLKNKQRDYFVVKDISVNEQVNFIYSKLWPTKVEANPADNGILIGEPIGAGAGLGVLGFCYVPYHFVYDLQYPVMVQVYDEKEMFQFPVVVIIDKNKPRQGLDVSAPADIEAELCNQEVQDMEIYTYDTTLQPVKARISFKCLNIGCNIGETEVGGSNAVLKTKVPQCVNGYLVAEAPGYRTEKMQISTNRESVANIIMDKLYNLTLSLKVNGRESNDFALVYLKSKESLTIAYPEQKNLQISEGDYNISVFVYKNGSITLGAYKETKCTTVPRGGILGFLGVEEEKCFDINVPEQTITNVISGGGKAEYYFTESELEKGKILEINVDSFPVPSSVEELPGYYSLMEVKSMDVEVK